MPLWLELLLIVLGAILLIVGLVKSIVALIIIGAILIVLGGGPMIWVLIFDN